MYENPEITYLRPTELELLEQCPASRGWSSELPRWPLFRWQAIRDALRDLAGEGVFDDAAVVRAIERTTSGFDRIQREICERALRTFLRMFPPQEDQQFDWWPDPVGVERANQAVALTSSPTFLVRRADGLEVGKLRTGRRRTSRFEAAVLLSGIPAGAEAYDAMLVDGAIEPYELQPEERTRHVERLFGIWEAYEGDPHKRPRPGQYCHLCERPAQCGAYPALDGRAARARHRAIKVSKGSLGWLDVSERRVAWKHLYGIPGEDPRREDGYDLDELVDPRGRGLEGHAMLAKVIVAEDPGRALKDYLALLPASERRDVEMYWDHHQEAEVEHDQAVSYKESEYPIGTTLIVPGHPGGQGGEAAEVAVVVIGTADAVGREADGTPAVVDHKTGALGEGTEYERDLYAVGSAVRLARFEDVVKVAVHIHKLAPNEKRRCERRLYGSDALRNAWERLRSAAGRIASWDPHDSLSVECQHPDRCSWCPYERLCERFRSSYPIG